MEVATGSSIDFDFSEVVAELQQLNNAVETLQADMNSNFGNSQTLFNTLLANMGSAFGELKTFMGNHFGVSAEYQGVIVGILSFLLLWFVLWLVYKVIRIFI